MSDRREIQDAELEMVVGGALRWMGGKVWPKNNPTHVYTFSDYEKCTDYIKNHWPGGTHDEKTLQWLEDAGLVKKAY